MDVPADLFHPRHYEAVRKPLLQAETLPTWCYTSDAFYQREVERIWRKAWNFLGHVTQVANPGDYLAMEFAGVPLFIIRGKDNVLRAFANACRHRGSTLLDHGHGNCGLVVCPYHSWSYALDGTLYGAPEMHKTEGFDPAQNGLVPLRCESWGGFLFVCFDNAAPPLAQWLGGLPDKLECYNLDDMVLTRRKTFNMACNWKIFVENAKESYHIGTVHRATINKYASARSAGYWVEEATGEYVITFAQHENSMALLKGDAGFPPIESLAGRREAGGTYAPLLYPSTYLACTIDCAWYLELHPLGPDRTRLVHGALFPRSRTTRPDFEEIAANYYKRWDITLEEDIIASDRQQRGVTSPYCLPGRFSYREPLVHAIDNWVLDCVLDPA
ncbi:aromatic ring-hydroxylating oxygenase subunit alpha [Siccirubricoccus phaeus]|uniref:aromatic ring-hydroxylating oxygenase subunit alpha n=1 Tax=Siccirubricoccus phaeus TaxID=2595053 RepID=UPI0011F14C8D|nr:aromatic ring-hydroxylating dioxygenase subunit alpha [Siccirubricoccus phaeus]